MPKHSLEYLESLDAKAKPRQPFLKSLVQWVIDVVSRLALVEQFLITNSSFTSDGKTYNEIIDTSATLNIPADHLTIDDLIDFYKGKTFKEGVVITVEADGGTHDFNGIDHFQPYVFEFVGLGDDATITSSVNPTVFDCSNPSLVSGGGAVQTKDTIDFSNIVFKSSSVSGAMTFERDVRVELNNVLFNSDIPGSRTGLNLKSSSYVRGSRVYFYDIAIGIICDTSVHWDDVPTVMTDVTAPVNCEASNSIVEFGDTIGGSPTITGKDQWTGSGATVPAYNSPFGLDGNYVGDTL